MLFKDEKEFEEHLVNELLKNGWQGISENQGYKTILKDINEDDLIRNWKNIIFFINKKDLNNVELNDDEMNQIMNKVESFHSIADANMFINGERVLIKRTNQDDIDNFNKEIYLKIFGKKEINAGDSIYQIARQVKIKTMLGDRILDLVLLVNGMPFFHIELKNENLHINNAIRQLKNYSEMGLYSRFFKLVQVLVAMKPNQMFYMPNTYKPSNINQTSFLVWKNEKNIEINDWKLIVKDFLSIPMAHRMVADFTVADYSDSTIKILRSYQYHAVNIIQNMFFAKKFFNGPNNGVQKGGFVWHTTGSGKTLTSYKLSQLLLEWNYADIVVFVVDRIELETQTQSSFHEMNKSSNHVEVKKTNSTKDLFKELISSSSKKKLIVSSIYKQYRINESNFKKEDLDKLANKKIVFIFDEAHRTTFGDMYTGIIKTLKNAVIFGFTGTPIVEENSKNGITSYENFGPLIHKYTMKNAIDDKKVLGFNCEYVIFNYDFKNLISSNYDNNFELSSNESKIIHTIYPDDNEIRNEKRDFELLANNLSHKKNVARHILNHWKRLNQNKKFSAIFATSSISDAIKYFDVFQELISEYNQKNQTDFKVTALFDPNIDFSKDKYEDLEKKYDSIKRIIDQYNLDFKTSFDFEQHADFKIDLSNRLAHKNSYLNLSNDRKLDLLIVVEQMLTGFDSKWISSIYFDKKLEYEHLVQAISRTNRIFDPMFEKPWGNVIFYRTPLQMKMNLDEALRIYADIDPKNSTQKDITAYYSKINESFKKIRNIFETWGIHDFGSIPQMPDVNDLKFLEYAKQVKDFSTEFLKIKSNLNAFEILGFEWENNKNIDFDKDTWNLLKVRKNEADLKTIYEYMKIDEDDADDDLDLEIDSLITTEFVEKVDSAYINSLTQIISETNDIEVIQATKEELNKMILKFPVSEQKYARQCLEPTLNNNQKLPSNFDLNLCVFELKEKEENLELEEFAKNLNVNIKELKNIIHSNEDIYANNNLQNLCRNSYNDQVREYISEIKKFPLEKVKRINIENFIKEFILHKRKNTS